MKASTTGALSFLRWTSETSAVRVGEGDRALGLAREQFRTEQGFERADLMAERRTGNIETFRRAAEMQFIGDGDKVSQMAKRHWAIMSQKLLKSDNAVNDIVATKSETQRWVASICLVARGIAVID